MKLEKKPDAKKSGNLAVSLGIAAQLFLSRMERLLAPQGVSLAQFSILSHLSRRNGVAQRISDIAAAVEVNQPAVTKAISKFENMGLVHTASDIKDQRSRLVSLSDAGRTFLQESQKTLDPDFDACFDSWSSADIDQFTSYLRKLSAWYDANR